MKIAEMKIERADNGLYTMTLEQGRRKTVLTAARWHEVKAEINRIAPIGRDIGDPVVDAAKQ